MNSDLVKKALEKVSNVPVLINLVSCRVRQLNAGGGGRNRPLVSGTDHLSAADIALREIIEGKMDFELPEFVALVRPSAMKRNRPKHWAQA